ncbi:non-ribosomal peptide synthetase [Verrucosispora sp. WMMD573]|uniref:non-ribosomal peptide synthetase n=1 Tax=Verrucosispora sp. WMMD573 TaxID=3015149 RepID=UPI00248B77B3|nr:non-ribosomal peptide synthetase [Verrucosispora sp. WMMD573]WBB51960.1 amino acid adenylation domain-containing protein [Verrucosispora sp. WMMD573]
MTDILETDNQLRLSFEQEQLWFLDQVRSGTQEYLLHWGFRLRGPLNRGALTAACTDIAGRHEILRTRYATVDGQPVQIIDEPAAADLTVVDLTGYSAAEQDRRVREIGEAAVTTPIDLRESAPWRLTLVQLSPTDAILVIVVHHIAFDGPSLGILARELGVLYAAHAASEQSPLEPLDLQYADFADWQRSRWDANDAAFVRHLNYWRERLAGLPSLELPTDRQRPATWEPAGDVVAFAVPAPLAARLSSLGRTARATPFMVFLAAYQLLISRYADQLDFGVGVSTSGRNRVELEPVIGSLAQTVVLRTDLSGDPTFVELLGRVRETALDAFEHKDVPLQRLAAELSPDRGLSRNPLFQVGFAVLNGQGEPLSLPGIEVDWVPTPVRSATFDMSMQMTEEPDGSWVGRITYPTALFDRTRIERIADNYLALLEKLAAAPDTPLREVPTVTAVEQRQLLGWCPARRGATDALLPELFRAQADATPDAVAVVCGDVELTYAQLRSRADGLAGFLHTRGVGAETAVGVALHRGTDLVVALLGTLTAGAVYVPLAPDLPDERLEFMIDNAGVELVLTDTALRQRIPQQSPVVVLDEQWDDIARATPLPSPVALDAANAAYVMYTSGSTGRPKGVVISHDGIRNRVLWAVDEFRLTSADRVLQKTTIGFDASMWEFLAPLVSGGCVVMAPPAAHRDTAVMVGALAAYRITVVQLVPSVLRTVVEEPELAACDALRLVCSAGEPLPTELCERLLGVREVELYNTYGPTESSIDVTAWRYRRGGTDGTVPIGAALPGVDLYVVDCAGRLAPIGVPGELRIGGVGLARGYAGRGDLTAERFTPNPFATRPGQRWYHTGDLARWRDDGVLEFLGRLDAQVKVRGVRVEPGEVEAALRSHPSVAAVVVTSYRSVSGDLELAGYVVPAAGATVETDELSGFLGARLPAAMVPASIVPLAALPSLPNGKVDRSALPAPGTRPPGDDPDHVAPDDVAPDHVAPRTETERAVATLMSELTGVERIGVSDDFFTLGGHSLLAIRLAHRLRRRFGLELTVATLFEGRTVERVAAAIDADTTPDSEPQIVPVPRDSALPTSFGQQRLWFLDQLEPGSAEYLIPMVYHLTGKLDTATLRRAVEQVSARHEVLRTRYVGDSGVPRQLVDPPGPVPFDVVDLTGTADAAQRARTIIEAASARPFDLTHERPLRVTVVHTAVDEHLVALTLHHIAFDNWSLGIFLRELNEAYAAELAGAPWSTQPLPVQYADFAAWQRDRQADGTIGNQIEHWRSRLTGLVPVELAPDRPRQPGRDLRGELLIVDIPQATGAAVRELGNQTGATLFMVLLAAFDVLLSRHTGRTDIAIGTPVAGRTRPETEDLIGFFVNNLVVRSDLSGNPTFLDLVDRVRRTALEAFANQEVPFEHLVDALQPDRDLSRNPLFQIMFEVQHTGAGNAASTLAGCTATGLDSGLSVAKFDLTLSVMEQPDGRLECWFEYATALFDRATIERLAGQYLRLLGGVTADPQARISELELLSVDERHTIVRRWADPDADKLDLLDPPGERHLSVPELFEQWVARTPDATAVVFGADRLGYAELNARANELAHRLRAMGVGPEVVVGSCLQRGIAPVVVLLAVLKAGGVYVPFDPEHPPERLRYMLADAGAQLVVTSGKFADRFAGHDRPVLIVEDGDRASGRPVTDPAPVTVPDNLAYIIYTSGSTGRPKGVMISHRAYAHHCRVIADYYGIRSGERVVQLSALTFDVAMDQIGATLATGATIVVSDPVFWTPNELPAKLAQYGVTIMEITPAYYREMMESGVDQLAGLKLINISSDVVTVADAQRWAAGGLPGRFLCTYGPTEATVTCMLNPVSGDLADERSTATLHIGRAAAGTQVYVLDAEQRPLPVGVPGELYLGGVRLARGYHDRPELTAERFVPDPFATEPGARLYRTGDLVRLRPDGNVDFLGRLDTQVKIRGFRIELAEIEAVLARHPAVPAAAVVARDVGPGDKRLVAYLEWSHDTGPDLDELRAYLRESLPSYMIPSAWVTVAALPLTPSKKVDRAALPDPKPSEIDGARGYVAPRDPAEETIAGIWSDILGVERVGVDDDFFGLGGHSLLATRVLARLRAAFAVEVPLRCLFEATTVAELAVVVSDLITAELDELTDAQMSELLSQDGAL